MEETSRAAACLLPLVRVVPFPAAPVRGCPSFHLHKPAVDGNCTDGSVAGADKARVLCRSDAVLPSEQYSPSVEVCGVVLPVPLIGCAVWLWRLQTLWHLTLPVIFLTVNFWNKWNNSTEICFVMLVFVLNNFNLKVVFSVLGWRH